MYLFSRAVSSQVSSTYGALTTVFGMGTGVALPLFTPDLAQLLSRNLKIAQSNILYWF